MVEKHATPFQISAASFVYSTRYVQVASITLLLYDNVLTAQEEIDFVWRGAHARSWPRMIFLTARYAPVIVLIFNSFSIMGVPFSENFCVPLGRGWLLFHGWSGFCFFAAVQVISQLRLWAIYRSKQVLYAMSVIISLGLVGMGVVEGLGYNQVTAQPDQFVDSHVGGLIHICGPGPIPHYVYAFWIPPLVIETISVVLVVYKAVRHFQLGAPKSWAGSRFMNSIVRYSVLYFIVVLCVYVANFYVWFRLEIFAFELFIPLTFALPSVAGNRMLLSLRGIFYEDNAMLPGKDDIGMKIMKPDRGLTIETHNPLKEFESFFGQNNQTAA